MPKSAAWIYAVRVGRCQGLFATWAMASAHVNGYARAEYKKFSNLAEARAWLGDPEAKLQGGTATAHSLARAKAPAPAIPADGMLTIHTDGSALGNGTADARAGIGVYYGPLDARNVSRRLDPAQYRQTNQVSEIVAALTALEQTPKDTPVRIVTDSIYVVKAVNEWRVGWKARNWQVNLVNMQWLRPLSDAVDARPAGTTVFQWTQGHAGNPGNEAADALADAGALSDV